MLPQVVLVDGVPKCVVRPTDKKALDRFVRNGKKWLLAGASDGECACRPADEAETARWKDAYALHMAWGGDEEGFFGIPLASPPAPPSGE